MRSIVSQTIQVFLKILEVKSENKDHWLKLANKCLGFMILTDYESYLAQKAEFEALIKETLTAGEGELSKLKILLGYDSDLLTDEDV
jgi:hypothetical protein